MTSPSLTKINKLTFAGDVEPQWSVFAVGDFCDLRIRHDDTAETPRISGELQQLIQQSDLSIVNLEAPLVDSPDPLPKVGPHIHMSTDVASALARCGFDVASLANNHMMDYGSTAQGSTIAACREQGISTCGAGENQLAAFEPVRLSPQQGIQVSLVGCCEQEFGVATKDKAGVAWISDPMALRIIEQEAKLSDVVIVIAHGGVEEVPFSPIQRQAQLRQFIDAGATLVIGHHPHVPQGWETYRHGIIFHSLGNFIFDYPEGKRWPKTDWGLAIQAHFNGSTLVDVDLIPVETRKDGTVAKLGLERSLDECLQYLHELSRIIRQPDRYAALWQETAVFLWEKRQLMNSSHHPTTLIMQEIKKSRELSKTILID